MIIIRSLTEVLDRKVGKIWTVEGIAVLQIVSQRLTTKSSCFPVMWKEFLLQICHTVNWSTQEGRSEAVRNFYKRQAYQRPRVLRLSASWEPYFRTPWNPHALQYCIKRFKESWVGLQLRRGTRGFRPGWKNSCPGPTYFPIRAFRCHLLARTTDEVVLVQVACLFSCHCDGWVFRRTVYLAESCCKLNFKKRNQT